MPPPPASSHLTFWPWKGIRVTCDVCYLYLCTNFSLPRHLCSRLKPDERNRQTQVRRASSLNAVCQGFRFQRRSIATQAALDIKPVTTASGYFLASPTCTWEVIDVTGSYFLAAYTRFWGWLTANVDISSPTRCYLHWPGTFFVDHGDRFSSI